jgi:hypothetical protein
VDTDNSFDDHYLNADDIQRLLEALDAYIGISESQWAEIDHQTRERWVPYRVLRARLAGAMGMRIWDDAARWLDERLREERIAALQSARNELHKLLADPSLRSRQLLERRMMEFADSLQFKRFSTWRPETRGHDLLVAKRDRTKEPYGPGNWRRRDPTYGAAEKRER